MREEFTERLSGLVITYEVVAGELTDAEVIELRVLLGRVAAAKADLAKNALELTKLFGAVGERDLSLIATVDGEEYSVRTLADSGWEDSGCSFDGGLADWVESSC